MTNINDFVDKIYCINLDRRTDRWDLMVDEFKRFDIESYRFSAIDGMTIPEEELKINHPDLGKQNQGAQGALRSHRSVLKDAIDNDYDRICVFEDDIIFCSDFKERFDYYSNVVPKNWDIMYLGCHFHGCPEPKMVKTYVYKSYKNFGAFAFILNKKMIHTLYRIMENEQKTVDDYIADIVGNYNTYCFIPFFVKTANTISDVCITNDQFEYEIVNEKFRDKIELIKVNKIKGTVIPPKNYSISDKELLRRFVNSNKDFIISKGGRVIFDSTNNKNNISLYDNNFKIYGKEYEYIGINVKNK